MEEAYYVHHPLALGVREVYPGEVRRHGFQTSG
jgi:hypothetical protein